MAIFYIRKLIVQQLNIKIMTVKKHQVTSGPSINKVYWTLFDDNGKEIGALGEAHMYEVGGMCSGGHLARKWGDRVKLYPTMTDAITEGLGVEGTWEEIDAICELFLEAGYKLAY